MQYVMYFLLLIVVLAVLAAAWRFTRFRNAGATGLFRLLPAQGVHGWRHGVLRYKGEELLFYKLRSLSLTNDLILNRRDITIDGFRELTAQEHDFIPGVSQVLQLTSPRGSFEFAGQRHAQMALISWVEAAPDRRQERRDLTFWAHQEHQAHHRGNNPRSHKSGGR
ncbi:MULTISPECIES: DUF2550 domain-containing protein [unclassified Corynebacterium]|uniref:DUF2550 domain-containing protein n=1 Tax=unclassified Corynebacterium TaxID=2624378 RepID=UPI002A9121C3|nr:DUF2550 domain-containing protein [Corynebacterium sp.]MDY5785849.1 DUF2550 domain-containing protein [Corynebacterium sp.]